MRHAIPLAALVLALPLPLLAQSADAETDAPSALPAQEPGEKVICKQEKQLGSRLASKKTCLTERQWRERAAQAQEQLDRQARSGNGSN